MKNYKNFLYEKYYNDNSLFYGFVDYYYGTLLTIEEKSSLNEALNSKMPSYYLITEGEFFDKLKKRYDKAKTVVKNFSDDAKKALEKIIDAANTAVDFVTNVVNKIGTYTTNILTNTKQKIYNKLSSDKRITEEVKKIDKENILTDLKTAKNVYDFYKTKLKDSLIKKIKEGLTKATTAPEEGGEDEGTRKKSEEQKDAVAESLLFMKQINEGVVDMGKNVIATIVHKLEEVPPFNWLAKVKDAAEQGVNKLIESLSFLTKNLGGPAFNLPVIATVIAIAIEYNIKGLAKSGLIETALDFAIPFIGIVIKVVAMIATIMACIELIDKLTGGTILKHGGGEHNEGEHEKKEDEIKHNPVI